MKTKIFFLMLFLFTSIVVGGFFGGGGGGGGSGDFLADGTIPMTGALRMEQGTFKTNIFSTGSSALVFQNQTTGQFSQYDFRTQADDGTDSIFLVMTAQSGANLEGVVLAYEPGVDSYLLYSRAIGSGSHKPIKFGHFVSEFPDIDTLVINIDETVTIKELELTTGPLKFTQNGRAATLETEANFGGLTDVSLVGVTPGDNIRFGIRTADSDGTDSIFAFISAKGTGFNGGVNEQFVYGGFDTDEPSYLFYSLKESSGTLHKIRMGMYTGSFSTVDQIILNTDDTVTVKNISTNGYLATMEQVVAMVSDDQSVTALQSMIRVTSDNVTATNRTMNLQNGTINGQRLTIISDTPTNAWELLDTGNQCLNGAFTPADNDSISLVWNSTTACWHEPR